MAVKPLTQPLYWATDAVYSTGPFIGQPQKVVPPGGFAAEGHRPGALFPTPAEYENSQQYNLTGLARWVFAGSSAGAADAHVLETNAAGRTAATGLTINDPVNETAVSITAAATALNFGLLVSCTTGGTAVATSVGNAGAINYLGATGSGGGAEGMRIAMASTPNTGTGVRVNADATTAAPAIRVEHQGTGAGLLVTHIGNGTAAAINGGAGSGFALTVNGNTANVASAFTGGAGQPAIQALSGNNASAAVNVTGSGTAIGVDAFGGNGSGSADGVRGTAVNANAAGVHGRSASGAGGGAGVQGDGLGAGQIGVYGTATAGYAFQFQGDTTPPLYPIGRFVPQNVDPSASTNTGDFTISVQNQFRYCVAGFGYKPFMTMPTTGSAVLGISTMTAGNLVSYGTGAFSTVVLTVSCLASQGNGFYSSSAGNTVKIRFSGDVKTLTAAATTANVQIQDFTLGGLGVPIFTWQTAGTGASNGFLLPNATNEWQRTIVCEVTYPPPADGDLVIRVLMSSTLNNQAIRNARLEVIGSF